MEEPSTYSCIKVLYCKLLIKGKQLLAFPLEVQATIQTPISEVGGHGGRVVTLSPPTSEVGVRFLAWPQVGKLVVACRWFTVQNPSELYVLVSSALPTTRRDMTCTVLKET